MAGSLISRDPSWGTASGVLEGGGSNAWTGWTEPGLCKVLVEVMDRIDVLYIESGGKVSYFEKDVCMRNLRGEEVMDLEKEWYMNWEK